MRLAGAVFRLYRWDGVGSPPALVTQAGIAGGDWVLVPPTPVTSLGPSPAVGPPNPPISLTISTGNIYHLVEVVPPTGHRAPLGQWRLQVVPNAAGTANGIRITIMGEAPPFINVGGTLNATYNAFFGGTFYVGNLPNIELPLTGGLGRNVFIAGAVVLVVAMGGAVWLVFKRQRMRA